MNQRARQPITRPPDRAPDRVPGRSEVPSAVRMIARDEVPDALSAAGRTPGAGAHHEPIVARPEQIDELTEVVDHLRAGRAVVLELEALTDGAARRQARAFVSGAAYALDMVVTRGGPSNDSIVLGPAAADRDDVGDGDAVAASETAARTGTCVLCDLRTADSQCQPPLEMVVKRDGSRIWSPPAPVCSHCRETIRHWKFALAWCSECERWGRRNVVSRCGRLYG
jgi:hypothetical protein